MLRSEESLENGREVDVVCWAAGAGGIEALE